MKFAPKLFTRPRSQRDERWIQSALKDETFSGALLIISALVAVMVANSSLSDWYFDLHKSPLE